MTTRIEDRFRDGRTWAVALLIGTAALIGWYVLEHANQFPRLNHGELVVVGAFLAAILAAVLLRDTTGGVWLLGLLLLAAVPALLLLAQSFVSGEVRQGIQGLVYLYGAGMIGGLVLELLHDKRHVIELPSISRPDADSQTEAADIARPGPKWNLGFLSRLIVGGLAGLALVTLIGTPR